MGALALDVSNVNPASEADVRASGAVLLICKATEGSTFLDKTLNTHRAIAKKIGIRFGVYVFLHALAQGDEAGVLLAWAKPKPGELIFIDSEPGGQDNATVSQMAHRTNLCAQGLEAKGHRPILYASSSYWLQMVACEPSLRRLRVWEAEYPRRGLTRFFPRLFRLRQKLRHGASVVMWQATDAYLVGNRKFDASLILVDPKKL